MIFSTKRKLFTKTSVSNPAFRVKRSMDIVKAFTGESSTCMKIKDILTDDGFKYCTRDTSVSHAVKTMKQTRFGSLPVLDENRKVIGMLKYADVGNKKVNPASTVNEFMSNEVHSVQLNDELSETLIHMRSSREGRWPVVNPEGKLAGTVSLHNLMAGLLRPAEQEDD